MEASIDIGNSRIKAGIFDRGNLITTEVLDESAIVDFLKAKNVERIIISSVGGKKEIIQSLQDNFSKLLEFTAATPIPIKTSYTTPQTLGIDRLAAAVGALQHFSGPLLVIDAGSCITVDLIDADNVFAGGSISPGLGMRLEAMHTFTESLPLLKLEAPPQGVPNSTREAMLAGAVIGAKHELIGFIRHYEGQFPEIKVILCGGDAKYFDKMNELNIFVLPNLVIEGLNAILRFNGEE
jgi:type III pantothenate kinase